MTLRVRNSPSRFPVTFDSGKRDASANGAVRPVLIFAAVFLMISVSQAQTYGNREIISIQKNQVYAEKLIRMNLDLLMEKDGKIYIVASEDDLMKLENSFIPYVVESDNIYPQRQKTFSVQGGINGDFHSYPELEQDLTALADTYPETASLIDIGDSIEGRNIYALKISDNAHAQENEAAVLILGCHHAREWISVEVPYLLGKHLLENYGSNTRVRDLVDNSEIWIVPLVNPDGLEYSIHFYRYWRKNRKNNGDGTFGVDLNRNYGYKWGNDNLGSSPDPASDVYRGEAPFSETESQAVRDLLSRSNFQVLVTYHNYSQVILYPWGYTKESSQKDGLLSEMAANMSNLMEAVNGRIYEPGRAGASLYLTNGDTTDWSFGVYGIPSFTVELPPDSSLTGQFFNPASDIPAIFSENLPAILYLIEWAIDNFQPPNPQPHRQNKPQDFSREIKHPLPFYVLLGHHSTAF
jgi:hypothetical protein